MTTIAVLQTGTPPAPPRANITLNPGLDWNNLPKSRSMIDQTYLLNALEHLRAEWNDATGGNIDKVTLNLNLFINDIIEICKGTASQ